MSSFMERTVDRFRKTEENCSIPVSPEKISGYRILIKSVSPLRLYLYKVIIKNYRLLGQLKFSFGIRLKNSSTENEI